MLLRCILLTSIFLNGYYSWAQSNNSCQVEMQTLSPNDLNDGNFYFKKSQGYHREGVLDPTNLDLVSLIYAQEMKISITPLEHQKNFKHLAFLRLEKFKLEPERVRDLNFHEMYDLVNAYKPSTWQQIDELNLLEKFEALQQIIPFINSYATYHRFILNCTNGDKIPLSLAEQKELKAVQTMILFDNIEHEINLKDELTVKTLPILKYIELNLKNGSLLKNQINLFLRKL